MNENTEIAKQYRDFFSCEIIRDSEGKPIAYRAGGITSTSPPMGMGEGLVIW